MIALCALLAIAAPPVPAKPPASERLIYWVDLERAVLATTEGKRIKAEFDEAVEAVENDVQAKESRVYQLRKELERTGDPETRRKYDQEVDAIDQMISREEKRLDEAQDTKLAPILTAMRSIIARQNHDHAGKLMVIDLSEHAVVNGNKRCDATTWLVRSYESKKDEAIAPADECKSHVFCLLDMERLVKAMDESKKAAARLDAFQKEKQAELDTKQTELKRMEAKLGARAEGRAEYERARVELAARYSAYQKVLKDKERVEEGKVKDAARSLVAEVGANAPGALFIDTTGASDPSDNGEAQLNPKCDVSSWFVDLAKKSTKLEDFSTACPIVENGAREEKEAKSGK